MMLRLTSEAVRARVRTMFPADTTMFVWVSGTIFGREVVPEVCSTKATSCSFAKIGSLAIELQSISSSITSMPRFLAQPIAGDVLPASTMSAFARMSDK